MPVSPTKYKKKPKTIQKKPAEENKDEVIKIRLASVASANKESQMFRDLKSIEEEEENNLPSKVVSKTDRSPERRRNDAFKDISSINGADLQEEPIVGPIHEIKKLEF